MARLLANKDADFYWNVRVKQELPKTVMINRIAKTCFTSKAGLCAILQEIHWFTEPGIANLHFPRSYHIAIGENISEFLDDYRYTACMSLLKYFANVLNTAGKHTAQSHVGTLPLSTLKFAIDRCNELIHYKTHADIDLEGKVIVTYQWEQFLRHQFLFEYKGQKFLENCEVTIERLHEEAVLVLDSLATLWPQYNLDGMHNVWIVKPGNSCRGIGIHLLANYNDLMLLLSSLPYKHSNYVVQKYVEKPFLIFDTKFDIRQWFLVASTHPLTIWMYKECYIRFSSQPFDLFNCHESVHLTNNAVQRKYKNAERNEALPVENMWDLNKFKAHLQDIGETDTYETVIYPGMKQAIVAAMVTSQEHMDTRPNCFQIYGADFILNYDLIPWLLEINSCPDMRHSTSITARLCPRCLEDVIRVVVDRKNDPNADTGLFEKIYEQTYTRIDLYQSLTFCVLGKRINPSRRNNHYEYFCKAIIDVDSTQPTALVKEHELKSNCFIVGWIDPDDKQIKASKFNECGVEFVKKHDQIKHRVCTLRNSKATVQFQLDPKNVLVISRTPTNGVNNGRPISPGKGSFNLKQDCSVGKKRTPIKLLYFNDAGGEILADATTATPTIDSKKKREQIAVLEPTAAFGKQILKRSLLKRTSQPETQNIQSNNRINSWSRDTRSEPKRKLGHKMIETLYEKSVRDHIPANVIRQLLNVDYNFLQSKST